MQKGHFTKTFGEVLYDNRCHKTGHLLPFTALIRNRLFSSTFNLGFYSSNRLYLAVLGSAYLIKGT